MKAVKQTPATAGKAKITVDRTKLKLVIGEFELNCKGSEQEVREALRNFIDAVEAAIAGPTQNRTQRTADDSADVK